MWISLKFALHILYTVGKNSKQMRFLKTVSSIHIFFPTHFTAFPLQMITT